MMLVSFVPILVSLLIPSIVALDTVVHLGYASYRGQALPNGITQWLGLRYAAPPLGALRFAAPQDPLLRLGIQDATQVQSLPLWFKLASRLFLLELSCD